MKVLNKFYLFLFTVLCFVIPFERFIPSIPNIITLLMIASFPFVMKKNYWKYFNNQVVVPYFLILVIIFFEIFFKQRYEDFNIIKKMVIPLILAILVLPIKNFKIPVYGFLIGALIIVLISTFRIFNFYFEKGNFNFSDGEYINDVLLIERPYLGYISLICVFLLVYLKNFRENVYIKYIFTLGIMFFISFILLISARMALITLIITAFFCLFKGRFNKKYLLRIFIIIGVLTCAFLFNYNLQERFLVKNLSADTSYLDYFLKNEPRRYIWECAFKYVKDPVNFLLGGGFYNIENYMSECFSNSKNFQSYAQQMWFIEQHYNTHNQFIDFYMGSGIITFILFVFIFYILLKKTSKNKISFSFVLAIFFFCIVENVLHRQLGGYLFFLTLYIALRIVEDEKKIYN